MRPARRARRVLLAAALAGACAATLAFAAAPPGRSPGDDRLPGSNVRQSELPLRFSLPVPPGLPEPLRVQHPYPPLDPAHLVRLRRALDLRSGGMPARARDSLQALADELPHHPLVVGELASTEVALGDDRAAATLLSRERSVLRDSLLGAHDLAGALERTGKPRDAIRVALEAWTASPAEASWASGVLLHLAPLDPRGTTEALRAASTRQPWRGDFARGLAFLLARQGDPASAVRALGAAERPASPASLRRQFADEALQTGVRTDSAAALEALSAVAADSLAGLGNRLDAARRALDLSEAMDARAAGVARIGRGLSDLPASSLDPELTLELARGLRETGQPAEASALLARAAALPARPPSLVLEHALDVARTDPVRAVPVLDSLARAWPQARYPLAEAQFWTGQVDSALANFQRAGEDADSPDAMAALERTYLLEEKPDAPELRALGAIAWERWRGDAPRARTLADSLWQALPTASPFYAAAAMDAYTSRAAAREWREALVPLAAIADSLPGDRLAPLARQRAGEAWLALGDERRALGEFEECLARYPKAWNSPEVRRQVERLRKERHL